MILFRSDNVSGVSPAILDAIIRANHEEHVPSYGADEMTAALERRFGDLFETGVRCFPVGTGIAANALAMAGLASAPSAILCHMGAHIRTSEDGAVELATGGSALVPVEGEDGCISPDALAARLRDLPPGTTTLSLTQLTEAGTVYGLAEIAELAGMARAAGLKVHMDGARFANALVRLGCTPAQMTWKAGIDILSFGATKNGAMCAEAVIVFDRDLDEQVGTRLRRSGQRFSKMRFLAAQLDAYLDDELWLANARHANAMATRLSDGLSALPGVRLLHRVDGNEIFAELPAPLRASLEAMGVRIHPTGPERAGLVPHRLVTSFRTSPSEVDAFLAAAETASTVDA